MSSQTPQLKRSLNARLLWGLGVGYVISGMYFGWNLGLEKGGTLGLAIATGFVILMYLCFTFSYTELACAIPKAGGAFDYADRALGRDWGFVTGMAQLIEFVFAPPAIAFAIGAYFNLFLPQFSIFSIAVVVYLLFTALNIYGVKAAARFELIITVLAVGELLLFAGITLPSFSVSNLELNAFPHGWSGVLAALPFAIWFFLGIEGVANVAEETVNPQKTILKGFGSAILTLIILCVLTFLSAVGVAGWEAIVFTADGSRSDSPLPLALGYIVADSNILYHLLITVGLLGLVASFHGLILAAGRASFEMGRVRLAPAFLGRIHPRFQTPAAALLVNMFIGLITLYFSDTGEVIKLSVFGALSLYILSMISFIRLRRREPALVRPFRAPFYPFAPVIALLIATISLIAMSIHNGKLAVIYGSVLLAGFILYKLTYKPQSDHDHKGNPSSR